MSYDVIVLGIGAMGAAALERLASRGARVLGIEQWTVPNSLGSSGGDTRLIRKAYFEHPDYVPLLERAYEGWRRLEASSGVDLLYPTGTVYVGPPDGPLVAGSRRAAEDHGLALELLSVDDVHERFPGFRIAQGSVAAFEPEAGFVLAGHGINAFAERAAAQGATLMTGTRVTGWRAAPDGVVVTTDAGPFQGDALVVAAGSWAPAVCQLPGLALNVTRQPLFWLWPDRSFDFRLGEFPCWALELAGHPGIYYGFPSAIPSTLHPGVKFAHHTPGEACEPDGAKAPASEAEYQATLRSATSLLPGLRGSRVGTSICMYTNSRDGHFIVDRHPEHERVVLACGFSGHGFKFAPVMGELLADYALEGRSKLPADFLRIGSRDLWRADRLRSQP